MPAGGGLGMRTVWISLRAMNYTDQAFRDTIRNMKNLSKASKEKIKDLLSDKDAAMKSIQVGTLYAAMTMMVTQRLGQLLSLTQVGASYMSEFNASWQELKVSFADTLFTVLKPLLDVLQIFMNVIKNNSALRTVVVIVGLLGLGLFALYSVYMVLNGVMKMNAAMHAINAIITGKNTASLWAHTITIGTTTIAYWKLAVAMGAAIGAFTICYTLLQGLSGPAQTAVAAIMLIVGALVALWALQSATTMGFALVAGGIAAAGAVTLASQYTNPTGFAKGTRALPSTGMFLGHKGEIVYNPQTNRPAGVEDQVMGRNGRVEASSVTVNFSGDINTKADVEDIDDIVGRRIYRAVKGAT
jgi:hypothetical protein